MTAVPRRLLVLGAGPVGVEMAQAVRRLGGEVALVRAPTTCSLASPRRWARRSARSCAATASSSRSASHATAARREGDAYVLELDDGRELRGDRLLVATGRRPARRGHRPRDRRHRARPPRDPGRRPAARRRGPVGDRRRHRHLAAHPRRQVPGRRRRGEHPRRAARGALRGRAAGRLHRPAGGARWARPRPASAVPAPGGDRETATYTRAYAESNGFLTLLSDGERLTGAYALGPEAGEWLQQATLAIRARCRSTCCATRSSRSHLLGDLCRGAQDAARRDRA